MNDDSNAIMDLTNIDKLIHPSAIVDPGAELGSNVRIGPFCIVGSQVKLGNNVELKSHVVIDGIAEIGDDSVIYPFASLGQVPQILKYAGEESRVIIGNNSTIREYVTIQAGTSDGGMTTSVGNNCLLMVGAHIGHDCKIGNNVVVASYACLAGHVQVGDHGIIGGLAAVHQFVRIGHHAMIGGLSGINRDVIPYGLAKNERAHLEGINLVGMKRKNFDSAKILEASKAVEEIFIGDNILTDRIEKVSSKYRDNDIVQQIIEFLKQDSTRAFCGPKK